MSSRFEAYRADGTTTVDVAFWNRIFRDIDTRIVAIEEKKASFEQVEKTLIDVGLVRVNEVLQPAAERIFRVTELGFLIASSDEEVAFTEGQSASILIREGEQRTLFKPSAFIALTRRSVADDYVIGRTTSYDPVSGVLQFHVELVEGTGGPFDDWDIAALAGSVMAMVAALDEVRDARQEIATKAETAAQNASDAIDAKNAALLAKTGAEGALASLLELYRGPLAEPPVDGEIGHFYYDTTLQQARVYSSAGWVPLFTLALGGIRQGFVEAEASQTVFTVDGGFTFLNVWQNGALLTPGVDYTTASPDFTLTSGASGGDIIAFLGYYAADDVEFYSKGTSDSLFGMDGGTY